MGDFEVAVLGGGVAGAAAAIVLAAAGRRVVIVESEATPAWRIGETLAPEARPLLQELGVWDEFNAAGHLPCHGVCSRWGSERVLAKDHIFNPHGNAWQLDRAAFGALLLAAARRAGAHVLSGVACDGITGSGGNWRVRTGELELRAGVLVDATGRRAMLARRLGIKRHKADRLVSIHGLLAPPVGTGADGTVHQFEELPHAGKVLKMLRDQKRSAFENQNPWLAVIGKGSSAALEDFRSQIGAVHSGSDDDDVNSAAIACGIGNLGESVADESGNAIDRERRFLDIRAAECDLGVDELIDHKVWEGMGASASA